MTKNPLILFIILIMAASGALAQDQRLFKNLTVSDGLPHSEITSITMVIQ